MDFERLDLELFAVFVCVFTVIVVSENGLENLHNLDEESKP